MATDFDDFEGFELPGDFVRVADGPPRLEAVFFAFFGVVFLLFAAGCRLAVFLAVVFFGFFVFVFRLAAASGVPFVGFLRFIAIVRPLLSNN